MAVSKPDYKAHFLEIESIEGLDQYLTNLSIEEIKSLPFDGTNPTGDNDARAVFGARALLEYAHTAGELHGEGVSTVLSDLLADLRHLSDALGEGFMSLLNQANIHYDAERAGER